MIFIKPSKSHYGYGVILIAVLLTGLYLLVTPMLQAQPPQSEDEAYKIQWRDHTFYTNKPIPKVLRSLSLTAYPESAEGYYFVQFTGPVTKEMKAKAASAGAKLLNYVPNYAFIVKMDGAAKRKVKELSFVRWIGIYQPAMKLSGKMVKRITVKEVKPRKPPRKMTLKETGAAPVAIKPKPLQLTVSVFKNEDLEGIKKAVTAAGGKVQAAKKGESRSRLLVTIPREKALSLARINGVMWIEEFKMRKLHNDTARGVMNIAPVWNDYGLRGNGQIIALSDSGLDSGTNDPSMHDDIEGRIDAIFSWPVQPYADVINVGADDGAADLDSGHGTHTSGSALGNGTISGGAYSGTAPEAHLVFQALEQWTDFSATSGMTDSYQLAGIPFDLNDLFQQAYDEGVRIHSNSWGGGNPGEYDSQSGDVDEFVWNHPDILILYSAGNDGTDSDQNNIIEEGSVTSPGTAKNCLTVGASENNRPTIDFRYAWPDYGPLIRSDRIADNMGGMAAFSSRGAANSDTADTSDDRIKPDLVAPGTLVLSTRTRATANTIYSSDNMEGGGGSWTAVPPWQLISTDSHSATHSWHDSPAGDYNNNTNVSITWDTVDLSGGGSSKTLQFWCKWEMLAGDGWYIELSSDGVNWTGSIGPINDLVAQTLENWVHLNVGLGPPYSTSANFRLRFRLQSNASGTADGVYIDDVRIVEGAFGDGLPSEYGLTTEGSVIDQNYMMMKGTSMSTPLSAGAAALVRQYYMDEESLGYVSAALLRATLINGTVDMNPGQYTAIIEVPEKPNNVEGWGRLNLEKSIFPTAPAVLDHVDELAGLETGEDMTFDLNITDASVPIVVTMVYHDYPGAAIVNNLDMTLTEPGVGGTVYYPNGLSAADTRNNVEQIIIPTPVTGTYTITIDGQNVPEGPQPFALVTSAGGAITDRDPVDVMLVMDLSGSMLSEACPTCDSKLQVLKDAVELFIRLWTAVTIPDDRIGATYFKTMVSNFSVDSDVIFPVLNNADSLITDVQGKTAVSTDLTAMGGGLQFAIDNLTDTTRPRNIILFTDGMQNVDPMVLDTDDGLEIDTEPPTQLDMDLGITVNTIGVGSTPPFVQLLNDIADETGGITKITTAPDEDLRLFYVEELIDVLRDYSPQLIDYRYGTLSDGHSTETFTVSKGASQVILMLNWKRGNELSFQVEKDGIDLTQYGQFFNGPFYRIFSMKLPANIQEQIVNAAGNWQMKIMGTEGASYEAAAICDEHQLKYDFSIGGEQYAAGDTMKLKVRLSLGHHPVTDARKVHAVIRKPREGLGTLLSVKPMPNEPVGFQAENNISMAQKKLQLLLLDEQHYKDFRPAFATVTLQNNGDGTYTADFTDTIKAGIYTITFIVEGETPSTGEYRRTETLSTMVSIGKVWPGNSILEAKQIKRSEEARILELLILPKDKQGNYLGPDYGRAISVKLSQGKVGASKDQVDGSYVVQLVVPLLSNPDISVKVKGNPLFEGPLSELEKTSKFRFSLSLHGGVTYPLGNFGTYYDSSYMFGFDVDYHFTPQLSLVGLVGYNRFKTASPLFGDTYFWNISANMKFEFSISALRPYVNAGAGIYIPSSGNAKPGFNVGAGVNYTLNPQWIFELGGDYHHVFTSGNSTRFIVTHAGLIFRF